MSRCCSLILRGSRLWLSHPGRVVVGTNALSGRHIAKIGVTQQRPWSTEAVQNAEEHSHTPRDNRFKVMRTASYTFEGLLTSVNSRVVRNGRVSTADLNNLLRLLSEHETCSTQNALMLIRCCGAFLVDEKATRRTEIAMDVWKRLEQMEGLGLDVSHYNALLKIHLENGHAFSPLEFLSWMEEKGIEPNRVTYQNLMARFCHQGDMAGATAILEEMKKNDMPVNEYVFHNLILGHAVAKDVDAAKGAIKIMEDSDLHVGIEAYMQLIRGQLRANVPWEEVKEIKTEAEKQDIQFSDQDHFDIVLELARLGQSEAANEVAEMLPKDQGFMKEMRNVVSQLVFAGETDLAFKIYTSSHNQSPSSLSYLNAESKVRDHGFFFLKAMVQEEYSPEKVVGYLKSMLEEGENKDSASRILEACLEYNKIEYGKRLRKEIEEKLGDNVMSPKSSSIYFYTVMKRDLSFEETLRIMRDASEIGLVITFPTLSMSVMPKLLDDGKNLMEDLTQIRAKLGPEMHMHRKVINAAIQFLLNKEEQQSFSKVSKFLMSRKPSNRVPVWPRQWNASLARSYLSTRDMNCLVSVIFSVFSSVHYNDVPAAEKDLEEIFMTLHHLRMLSRRYVAEDETEDDLMEKVLTELKNLRVGIPSSISTLLKSTIKDDSPLVGLLSELDDFEKETKTYWSKEKIDEVSKELFRRLGQDDIKGQKTRKNPHAFALWKLNQSDGAYKHEVALNLSLAYLNEDKVTAAVTLMKEIVTKEERVRPSRIEAFSNALMDKGEIKLTLEFFQQCLKSKQIVYTSSFNRLFTAMLMEKDDASVHAMMGELDTSKISSRHLQPFIDSVVMLDSDRAMPFANLFQEKGLLGDSADLYFAILSNDTERAIELFEAGCRDNKTTQHMNSLTCKLIQNQDTSKMQRVLEAASSVLGEHLAILDLAMCFLSLDRPSQARKLLETPGLRYHDMTFKRMIRSLSDRGNKQAIEHLVLGTRKVFRCDREYLYAQLVREYEGDSAKLEDIWLEMQEEGFSPSESIKKTIAKALQDAGKPVPFATSDKTDDDSALPSKEALP